MSIATLVLLTMLTSTTHAVRSACAPLEPTQQSNTSRERGQTNGNQIKISIATGGGPYRPAKDTYRVGGLFPCHHYDEYRQSASLRCESGTLYQIGRSL